MKRHLTGALLGMWLAVLAFQVNAEGKPDDSASLKGLNSAKVVFDITQGDPQKLLQRLSLIEETAQTMASQGVTPNFVLAFRGPASFYASSDRARIPADKLTLAEQIATKIKEMSGQSGVQFEQCSVATRVLKIDNKTVYPEVKVVGNSWVSLAGYQNRGYAYIPID
jgi:intracellular sulfur oxidation DsrE/DsrF family protein